MTLASLNQNSPDEDLVRPMMKQGGNYHSSLLDSVLSFCPEGVYCKDLNGFYLGCSLEFSKKLDLSKEFIVGKSDFDIFSQEEAVQIRKNDSMVIESCQSISVIESVTIQGVRCELKSSKAPLKDDYGNVVGVISASIIVSDNLENQTNKPDYKDNDDMPLILLGVSLDENQQKDFEKLHEANNKLLNALEAKKIFFSNVSHEIKTPLSNILKISQLLYDDWEKYPTNEARKAHLKMAIDGNQRLQDVLTNLLDLSSFEAGKLRYNMENNSLVDSIGGVISEFIDKKHQVIFNYDHDKNYSSIFDRLRIEQVVRNLLSNAIKHSMDKNIVIELKNEGGFAYFYITDEGVGIPESELEEIFKIFVQGSRTIGSGGTGSGLAISKTIITDHGGKIWAEHNPTGPGSVFIFKIPFKQEGQTVKYYDNLKEGSVRPKSLLREIPADAPNLLLIDDESSILQVSKLVFERMGFRVTLADSGLRGLEVLEKSLVGLEDDFKIDVILLDMMLTDLSGIEVLKAIKEDKRLRSIPPIYIYSGMGLEDEIQKAIDAGANGFIDKTSSSKYIEKVLGKYLKKNRKQVSLK